MERPKGESEMDLIAEQSKKFHKGRRGRASDVDDGQVKYFQDKAGFVQFADGSKYKGPLKNGNPVGQGQIIYGDGSTYEGDWEEGNADGYGILTFKDLSRYEGEWSKGKYNGQGTYVAPSGACLLYTSPSPRDLSTSRMPSSA